VEQPDEEVVLAQPRVPLPEDVLPKRRKRRRRRKDKTKAVDASPAVPQVPSTDSTPAAAVAEREAGERGGVSPPVQADTGDLMTPRSPAPGCSASADGEAGPKSDSRIPSTPTALPAKPVAPLSVGDGRKIGTGTPATSAATEQSRAGLPSVEEVLNRRSGGVGQEGGPLSEGRLQQLLRLFGLRTGTPPLPNGSNGRVARPEGDNEGDSPGLRTSGVLKEPCASPGLR
jgi:hypothetical protein